MVVAVINCPTMIKNNIAVMPNLGASKTVVNTTTAPSTPPINFHQGCDGIVDKLPHKSVLANAIKKRKIVPTAKEIKVAITASPLMAFANCVLIADCVASATPAAKATMR